MNILIAGCGSIGNKLGKILTTQGHVTYGLRRNTAHLNPEILPISLDLTQAIQTIKLPNKIDLLYYLPTPTERTASGYKRIFVDGLANLLDAAMSIPIKRLIYISSTSVYGKDDGAWVDENTPPCPTTQTAAQLLAGETAATHRIENAVVVRFAGIYGGRRSRLITRVIDGAYKKSYAKFTNRIHEDDCSNFLAHLGYLESPEPLYIGVDMEPSREADVLDFIARRLELPLLPHRCHEPKHDVGKRCNNTRLLKSGYQLKYRSFRDGYEQLIKKRSG